MLSVIKKCTLLMLTSLLLQLEYDTVWLARIAGGQHGREDVHCWEIVPKCVFGKATLDR